MKIITTLFLVSLLIGCAKTEGPTKVLSQCEQRPDLEFCIK